MTVRMNNPPHPGLVLRDALAGVPMTVTDFAAHIGVARSTVNRVLSGKAAITLDMSMRLSEAFGQGQPDLWLRMQMEYDYWQASRVKRRKIKPVKVAA
jgi:addiction module HigA family antidote